MIHIVECTCHDPLGIVGVHFHIVKKHVEANYEGIRDVGLWSEGGVYRRYGERHSEGKAPVRPNRPSISKKVGGVNGKGSRKVRGGKLETGK